MEDIEATVVESTTPAEDTAGWDDGGWDDSAPAQESADDGQETAQDDDSQEVDAGAQDGDKKPDSAGAEGEKEPPQTQEQPKAPETLRIKYMNEERDIPMSEAVQLAQKGMDYDRIRGKWDDAKETISFIDEQARMAGMDRKAFIDYLRTETKKSQGMSEADARRAVELENRESAVAERENAMKQHEAEVQAQNDAAQAAREARDADFRRFAEKFPDVDAKTIGADVWARVAKGESLVEIWQEKEINRLKTEQAAAAQNAKNAGRSTGSMASSGGETNKKDPFDEGWED